MSEPREWLYGAEFWVPEDHMFKSGSECLETCPSNGPACGVVSTTAFEAMRRERDALNETIKRLRETGALNDQLKRELAELKDFAQGFDAELEQYTETNQMLVKAMGDLKAESEKLRAALEGISDMACPYGEGGCDSWEKQQIAREALK
jgi:hypothetical protein